VFLHVAQIVPHPCLKSPACPRVNARELKIDQVREPIPPHQDVLLLVQVIVTDAPRVQFLHEPIQVIEEILRQHLRLVQGFSLHVGPDQDLFRPRQKAVGARDCRRSVVADEHWHGNESLQGLQGLAFSSQEITCRSTGAGQPCSPGNATQKQAAIGICQTLDAAKAVALQGGLDLPAHDTVTPGRHPNTPYLVTLHENGNMQAPGSGAIVVRGLTRAFGQVLALAPLDLEVGPGGVTGLLGPNGSGKSTFLRTLIGLVPKHGGDAWLDGVQLKGDGTAIRKRCTFAPGELSFYGHLRADEQLDWLTEGRGREGRQRARQIAKDLELPLRARVRTFSHGMKRQLLFAGAMGPRVPVRVLDEITEGLDPSKRGSVLELLQEDAKLGTTILLSSHHLGEVQRCCDRMVFLNEGTKLSEESAKDVRSEARRTIRLRFPSTAEALAFEGQSKGPSIQSAIVRDKEVILRLTSDDPRAALVQLLSDGPAPSRIEYGELSLENLYRDLYGEDAC
jgi:ABC-2 type transport system ATP-binding protein